ncbi:hypothetical protein BZA77DRAFT_319417 [Pyronema omphalodes]|nr:hypothetical protein BZA77DRAFT_319417 [Pyronema omphalodes]
MPFAYSNGEKPPHGSSNVPELRTQLCFSMQPELDLSSDATTPQHSHESTHNLSDASTNWSSGITNRAELIELIKAQQTQKWIPDSSRNLSDRSYYQNDHSTNTPQLTVEQPHQLQHAPHQDIFPQEASRNRYARSRSPTRPASLCLQQDRVGPTPQLNLQTTFSRPERTHIRNPSISSGFILKSPTSPLVHSSNPDTDGSSSDEARSPSTEPIDISFSERRARRKSTPTSTLSAYQLSPTPTSQRQIAMQWDELWGSPSSRRRLSGTHLGHNPFSDLRFGSFVGSYEESILNGRMSTTPSKPLNFLAQIRVLGLGKCKPSLRWPSHVTLPFPAYFYSVSDYDSPSPYVGQIDLDSALAERGKKAPPGVGGCYRIPQRGQLQIVIKNPNKTAVKLFVIPYDLEDMEPGTKTFIRQKAYSAGSVEAPITDSGSASSAPLSRLKEKDSLRYLIHLHIVCPAKGRFYLFRNIRVVFANRVPDDKAQLRNEVLWPDPKYSPWKPETSHQGTPASLYSHPHPEYPSERNRHEGPEIVEHEDKMDLDDPPATEYQKVEPETLKKPEGFGLLAARLKEMNVENSMR